jgi:senataxin
VSFRQKREKEQAEKRKRDAAQIAIQRKKLASAGIAALTAEEGSGLNGIGIKGKDHAPPQSSIMVSDESSSSEDDEDGNAAMFKMSTTRTSQQVQEYKDSKARALNAQRQKPVKKVKQPRSIKDQRARLAPDLTALHKTILGWDFFHSGQFPPNSERNDYSMVSSTFRSPIEYQATFESLLVLEAWQGFLKVKEEDNFKPFDIRVANRMTVDSFIEVNTSMTLDDGKIFGIAETDIILLSKAEQPIKEPGQPHCLARVHSITRKKNVLEISYRVNTSSPLVASLAPNTTIRGTKITSIIPLEREYGALVALQYYDLCDEIIKAKPSPLLEYSDRHLKTIRDNYNVNYAQAKAIASAMDNDAFTLIQGYVLFKCCL